MNRLAMTWLGSKALVIACLLGVTTAQAGGFANPTMSASGLGVANAMVASADDVSAAAYNPAGIAWQDGIQAMVGVDFQYRNSSVELPAGIGTNGGGAGNPNHLYASWMPHDGNFGVSMAYNKPYEIDNNWTSTGQAALDLNRLSLDAIFAVNSSLALAAGIDWYLSTLSMNTPGQSFASSDKTSFGGHASMKWKAAPMWSVGVMARLGGKLKYSNSLSQAFSLKLPDEITVAVAHDVADAVRLEFDANWSRWSRVKSLNDQAISMRDSITLMTGATWFWRENSQLRFGYAYDQGANKGTAYNPLIADQTAHKLSLGAGGDLYGVHADVAVGYAFHPKKNVSGAYAGTYRDRRFSFALSVAKRF